MGKLYACLQRGGWQVWLDMQITNMWCTGLSPPIPIHPPPPPSSVPHPPSSATAHSGYGTSYSRRHGRLSTGNGVWDRLPKVLVCPCLLGYSHCVFLVTHVVFPWLLTLCFPGYSHCVSLVTHIVFPWLLTLCFPGYSHCVSLATHVVFPWLLTLIVFPWLLTLCFLVTHIVFP